MSHYGDDFDEGSGLSHYGKIQCTIWLVCFGIGMLCGAWLVVKP